MRTCTAASADDQAPIFTAIAALPGSGKNHFIPAAAKSNIYFFLHN
jgi:hypothetical protein